MIISYQKFYKLTNDIINFVNDIESLLVVIREIKLEIKKHFDIIIKKVYPDAKIEILSLQLAGKKRMGTAEFLRGFSVDGAHFA